MNLEKPYTFVGVDYIQIIPAEYNGWKIQAREDDSDSWKDISNGWFKTKQEAFLMAPLLCEI
jgi:hypothetical protein